MEEKVKVLIERYKTEMFFYEKFLGKLGEEMKMVRNGSDIEKTMEILHEKSIIMNNINIIENEIAPLKRDYMAARASGEFESAVLDGLLAKLSFLIEELIKIQSNNASILEANIEMTRSRLTDLKKRVMLVNKYKPQYARQEGAFIQGAR
jgi:flagellar biosynthesis/type III secretory pathway chaperone